VATETSPIETDVLDFLSSSDEEPSNTDSIFASFGSSDLFGNFDISQPVPTTLFIFCVFLVLPFIAVYASLPGSTMTNQNDFGFEKSYGEVVGFELSVPFRPQSRNLLMTENIQSPWPKDQIDQYQNNKPQTIITMEDVYMDEVISISHNISEITLNASYLKGTNSFVQHDK